MECIGLKLYKLLEVGLMGRQGITPLPHGNKRYSRLADICLVVIALCILDKSGKQFLPSHYAKCTFAALPFIFLYWVSYQENGRLAYNVFIRSGLLLSAVVAVVSHLLNMAAENDSPYEIVHWDFTILLTHATSHLLFDLALITKGVNIGLAFRENCSKSFDLYGTSGELKMLPYGTAFFYSAVAVALGGIPYQHVIKMSLSFIHIFCVIFLSSLEQKVRLYIEEHPIDARRKQILENLTPSTYRWYNSCYAWSGLGFLLGDYILPVAVRISHGRWPRPNIPTHSYARFGLHVFSMTMLAASSVYESNFQVLQKDRE